MRGLFLFFVLGLSAASSVLAAPFDITRVAPGTTYRWQAEDGNTSATYLGPAGSSYALAFTRDASKGHPLSMTWWVTRDGQMIAGRAGTRVTTFSPNDCSLTVGTCRYTVTFPDGAREARINVTSVSGKVWSYELYRDRVAAGTLLRKGTFTVDSNGFILNEQGQDTASGPYWTHRKP